MIRPDIKVATVYNSCDFSNTVIIPRNDVNAHYKYTTYDMMLQMYKDISKQISEDDFLIINYVFLKSYYSHEDKRFLVVYQPDTYGQHLQDDEDLTLDKYSCCEFASTFNNLQYDEYGYSRGFAIKFRTEDHLTLVKLLGIIDKASAL